MSESDKGLHEPIKVHDGDCDSVKSALYSDTGNRVFKILAPDYFPDENGLQKLINKDVKDYSINEIQWIVSLFNGGEITERFKNIQDRIAGKVKNIGINELKEYFKDKIFDIGIYILKNPGDVKFNPGNLKDGMLNLGFEFRSSNKGDTITIDFGSIVYNGNPIYFDENGNAKKITDSEEFSDCLEVNGITRCKNGYPIYGTVLKESYSTHIPFWTEDGKIIFFDINEGNFYSVTLAYDNSGKPSSGHLQLEENGVDIPFWTENGKYCLFPGIEGYEYSDFDRIVFIRGREYGYAYTGLSTRIPFWKNSNGKYETLQVVGVEEKILHAYSSKPTNSSNMPISGIFSTHTINTGEFSEDVRVFLLQGNEHIEVTGFAKWGFLIPHAVRNFLP